jgi:fido (protein-threonine AMPylation protein)
MLFFYSKNSRKKFEERNEEADKVAVRIAELLSENAFNFATTELLNIHKRLFKDIIKNIKEEIENFVR